MIVVKTVVELRQVRDRLSSSLGLVPTMGALHAGHLALVRRATDENASIGVSIFVNPRQFGPNEDFEAYPRDLDRDLGLLRDLGVDLVFAPDVSEMYPPGFSTSVDVGDLARKLEGARRPGHFTGVATVVARLFNLLRPARAYFGQKDAQQCVVVRKLAADLAFPLDVVVVPTAREADGLALSSRNVYLSPTERVAARVLSAALFAAERAYEAGERQGDVLRTLVRTRVEAEPLVRLDYVSAADAVSLDELGHVASPAILSLAAWVGKTRLIDNVLLSEEKGV